MLNITIDDPELENSVRKIYGNNEQAMVNAFAEFLQQQKIQQEVGDAIQQLEEGKGIPLSQAIQEVRAKYE